VEAIKRNLEYNKVDTTKVIPNQCDASLYMYQNRDPEKQFDVVDIDPYGGAHPFLDGAVQSVAEGGLLCVTCTDMAVLYGNHMESCYAKYGIVPIHARYGHEMALRIILGSIANHAAKYKRYIEPLLSLSIDFYARVFVRVYTSANEVKTTVAKMGNIYQCTGCDSFWTQYLAKMTRNGNNMKFTPSVLNLESNRCTQCEGKLKVGGPMWLEPIHDKTWVQEILTHLETEAPKYNQAKKIFGMLTVVNEELSNVPMYYQISSLCNVLHCVVPPANAFRSALKHLGYEVSSTHANPEGVKTSAPPSVLFDVLRAWVVKNPVKNVKPNSPGAAILAKETKSNVDFTVRDDAKIPSRNVPRYIPNPIKDWGPGTRAGKNVNNELRYKNQGKRSRNKDDKKEANKKAKKEEMEDEMVHDEKIDG